MHAGIDSARLGRVEGHAPDIVRGEAGIAQLPALAEVFGDRHSHAPPRHRDAVSGGGVEGDVGEIAARPQIAGALKADAAIRGHEEPAALRGSHPVAGIVRRLLDAQHLETGGAGGPPVLPRVVAVEDALFVARHQNSALPRIGSNCRRVFAVQSGAGVLPGGAAVPAHPNARGVAKVNGAGRVAIH